MWPRVRSVLGGVAVHSKGLLCCTALQRVTVHSKRLLCCCCTLQRVAVLLLCTPKGCCAIAVHSKRLLYCCCTLQGVAVLLLHTSKGCCALQRVAVLYLQWSFVTCTQGSYHWALILESALFWLLPAVTLLTVLCHDDGDLLQPFVTCGVMFPPFLRVAATTDGVFY